MRALELLGAIFGLTFIVSGFMALLMASIAFVTHFFTDYFTDNWYEPFNWTVGVFVLSGILTLLTSLIL